MRRYVKRVAQALCIVCVMVLFTGCSVAGRRVYFASSGWPFYVMKIGPVTCERKEVRVYLANYRNIYGHIGKTDLWTVDEDMFEVGVKNALVSHLARVCSLQLYANEKGLVLAADEKRSVAQAAKVYYESLSDDEKNYMGVSEGDIRSMYQRYALAEKVYATLMSTVDDEVSEDEARIMDAYVIHTKKKKTAKKIEEEIKNKADFASLTDRYTEGEKGKLSFGRGVYPAEVEEVCFKLENNEVSGMIKAKDGYYFVKCIDKYNKKRSEKNKEKLISQKKEKVLDDIIEDQNKKYYSNLDLKMLDAIHIEDGDKIKTESFFSTLDEYLDF